MTYFASRNATGVWELTNPEVTNVANFSFTPKSFAPGTGTFGLSQTTLGVAVDYGDALESYGTNSSNNGPRHRILFNPSGGTVLAIGATATSEPNGIPTANADGDTDDGVASFPVIAGGSLSQ